MCGLVDLKMLVKNCIQIGTLENKRDDGERGRIFLTGTLHYIKISLLHPSLWMGHSIESSMIDIPFLFRSDDDSCDWIQALGNEQSLLVVLNLGSSCLGGSSLLAALQMLSSLKRALKSHHETSKTNFSIPTQLELCVSIMTVFSYANSKF